MKTLFTLFILIAALATTASAQLVKSFTVASTNYTVCWTNTSYKSPTAYQPIGITQRLGVQGTNTFSVYYTPARSGEHMTVQGTYDDGRFLLGTFTDSYGAETTHGFEVAPILRPSDVFTIIGSGGTVLATNTTALIWVNPINSYSY